MIRQKTCRHGQMLYPQGDRYIGRSLEVYGEFSEGEVELFRRVVQPGNVVLDVGANLGAHTLPIAQFVGPTGKVYAFEPQRMIYYCLCGNIALNGLTHVICHQAAVGARAGTLMVPELDYSGENNFGGLGLEQDIRARGNYAVPVIRIDDMNLKRCDLIKIDVEGMEQSVLEGATETIRRCRPLIYAEDDRQDRSAALRAMLLSLGYAMYIHLPPFFNPANFAGNPENVFGTIVSLNLFCHPQEKPSPILPAEFGMKLVTAGGPLTNITCSY